MDREKSKNLKYREGTRPEPDLMIYDDVEGPDTPVADPDAVQRWYGRLIDVPPRGLVLVGGSRRKVDEGE